MDHGKILFDCASQYLNSPYKWGANGPFEFDCSGLIIRAIKDYADITGRKDLREAIHDMTSQSLLTFLRGRFGYASENCPGSILFYGTTISNITHVAIRGDDYIIEAGGAGRTTEHLEGESLKMYCIRHNARVRLSSLTHRKDFIAAIRIFE